MIARSYAWYEGPLAQALVHMKYRPNRKLSTMMAGWLADLYLREAWHVDLVTPVPLSENRLRQRGYNQAALISLAFAGSLGLRHSEKALVRVRETKSQVGLDGVGRFRNVQGAFRAIPEFVKEQRVLLVDDLYTTGATMSACAEALLDAGAKGVYGLTIGRARGKISTA
jgi:ComF family protein